MKINKKWFSLVIAIWLIIVISLMAYTILEYILPFSRNIKWVENSTKAYYYANSWIEKWLYYISTRKNKNIRKDTNLKNPDTFNDSWTATWYVFTSYSSGITLPGKWYWDSEFDEAKEWNRVSIWNPIQLSIWYEFLSDASNLEIYIRTPKTDKISRPELENTWDIWYLSWQLTGWNWALNSNSGSTIKANMINWDWTTDIDISNKKWEDLNWNTKTFSDAFNNFWCSSTKCILKLSVINDLKTTISWLEWPILPYLEWKIEAGSNKIPLRYSRIETTWKSYEFARNLQVRVPQETVNQAFDFAVFQ